MGGNLVSKTQGGFTLGYLIFWGTLAFGQGFVPEAPQPQKDNQINVNWFYGSYVPKEVSLQPLDSNQRLQLYLRRTYTARGIYIKTMLFAFRDQMQNAYPEWGGGFDGFGKRLGTRQTEFVISNTVTALGSGLLGWEPRYDRCRCTGFWPRTRHALVRNFVTYDHTEKMLRPQILPLLGAFAGSATVTQWEPGKYQWQVKGCQAATTQIPTGMAVNWIGEFAPEISRVLKRHEAH